MERLPFGQVREREAELTERQREVPALVARGKTNAEIGEALGMTFYGAKWHVSELLSKLGLESREELAEYWRWRNGVRAKARGVRAMFALPAVKWVAGGAGAAAVAGAAVFVAAFVLSSDEATAPEGPAPPISLFPVELVNRSVTPTLDPETLPTWARNTLEVEELGTADAADALQRASQHIGIDIAIARDFADSDLGLYKIDFFDDSDGRRVILYFDTFSADATQQKTTAVFINPGVVEPGSPYEDYAIGGDYRAKWTEGQQPGSAFQRRLWVTNGEYQVLINSMGPNALTLDEAARLARTLFE